MLLQLAIPRWAHGYIYQCKLGMGQFRIVRRGERNFGGTKSQILRQSAEEMILQYLKGSGLLLLAMPETFFVGEIIVSESSKAPQVKAARRP